MKWQFWDVFLSQSGYLAIRCTTQRNALLAPRYSKQCYFVHERGTAPRVLSRAIPWEARSVDYEGVSSHQAMHNQTPIDWRSR